MHADERRVRNLNIIQISIFRVIWIFSNTRNVLYDMVENIFIVSRDSIGMVPLYIGQNDDGSILYSSEFKALEGVCKTYQIWIQ